MSSRIAVQRLTKRRDFLAAAQAKKWATPGFVLQARQRQPEEEVRGIRIGYTASKKVGNAVQRNRAKRRLRALGDTLLPELGQDGWDYVLIARAESTATRLFASLQNELEEAVAAIHSGRADKARSRGRGPRRPARKRAGAA